MKKYFGGKFVSLNRSNFKDFGLFIARKTIEVAAINVKIHENLLKLFPIQGNTPRQVSSSAFQVNNVLIQIYRCRWMYR